MSKKVIGRPFEKGNQAAKGHGRPRNSPDLGVVKKALKDELMRVASVLCLSQEEAVREFNSRENSILHAILAKAVKKNDFKTIQYFIERIIGKIASEEASSDSDLPERRFKFENPEQGGGDGM